jgi:hypothetical protein
MTVGARRSHEAEPRCDDKLATPPVDRFVDQHLGRRFMPGGVEQEMTRPEGIHRSLVRNRFETILAFRGRE